MSDADSQMGGQGGMTGKDPDEGDGKAPDPVTGNMGKSTGEDQAEENQENDPPA